MPVNHNARVFARLLDWSVPTPAVDGRLVLRLECSFVEGDRKSFKHTFTCEPMVNVRKLNDEAVESLVAALNAKYPNAHYRERDVVLWGS